MSIIVIRPLENTSWLDFIKREEKTTIFHHPAWLSLLHEQYGFEVFALCMIDNNGSLEGGLPFCEIIGLNGRKKIISLPFSDICQPLLKSDLEYTQMLESVTLYCNRAGISSVEIRYPVPPPSNFVTKSDYFIHSIALLEDPDLLFKRFHKTRVREAIKQSMNRGVQVVRRYDKEGIEIFYNMLVLTRQRLGMPVQPKRFFHILWEKLIDKGLGFILLAYKDNEPIAGVVFLHSNYTLTAKYAASNPKHWNLRPNNQVYWSAIKWGCENGFKYFDWGRTEAANTNLCDFKKGWGSIETPLSYSYFPTLPESGIFSFVKDNVVGPIIRHSPYFVCKWSGELLYKYFA